VSIPGVEDGGESDARAEVLGVAAMVIKVSAAVLSNRSINDGLVLIGDVGDRSRRVKTTWKYGTGKSSAWASASHCLAATAWHFGQC